MKERLNKVQRKKQRLKGYLLMASAFIPIIFSEIGRNVMRQLEVPENIVRAYGIFCVIVMAVLLLYGASHMRCPHCNHWIAGNKSGRCPKCRNKIREKIEEGSSS